MFGFADVSVGLAYLLVILATILCVVYGIMNWNKGEATDEEIQEEKKWMKDEIELEEEVDGGVNS